MDGSELGATEALDLEVAHSDGAAVVRVRGELDAYSARQLEVVGAECLGAGATNLVLDLEQTSFIDSSGLRILLGLQRAVGDRRGRFTLRAPSEPVRRLLDLTGLSEIFVVD